MIIITLSISAMRGPMLLMVSGFLVESSLEIIPTSANIFGIDIPKDLPSNQETSMPSILSTSQGTTGYAWIRSRRHTGHL